MAAILKILGQSAPVLETLESIYTVPIGRTAVISSIVVCNQSIEEGSWRIAVCPNDGAVSSENWNYYDNAIPEKETFAATLGITLQAGSQIRVYSSNGEMSFSVYGQENVSIADVEEWSYGAKSSDTDEGSLGQKSFDDDYMYICVIAGVAGSATWKKLPLMIT